VDYVSVPVEPQILRARVSVFADLYRKTRQLERLNQELEQRVAERTAELTSAAARLRESEAALMEADRRKDDFLAMLAHELRNPLAPILNAVGVLRQRPSESELLWSYDVIDRQVGHLTRLVDDLLDVSRITRGKLIVRREPADLAEVLRWTASALQPQLADAGVHLRMALPAESIPAQVDMVRFSQIVHNLLDNACKFTRRGGTIWLTAEREGDAVTIRVRDSGIGIPAHDLPHIFEMFYRSTGVMSVRGGLGIGLALVRRLVELHGGTIEARSPGQDQGSEFVIRMPVVDSALRLGGARAPRVADEKPGSCRRILVVDDNRDSADSLAMLLRMPGNNVLTVYDGLAAVAAAESFRAEVVLLDIGLPLLDGHQVARRIREQPWGKSIKLIALTGWGQERDRRQSQEAGFDAHLTKPVDRAVLDELIGGIGTRGRTAGAMPRD
jgi:signal transduction histidine kinase/ActR/RegA family two-component response regulator